MTSPLALLASPDLDANKPCNLMQAVVSIKSLHSLQWFPIVPKIKTRLFKAPPQPVISFLSTFQLLSGQDFTLHFLDGPPRFRELRPHLSKPSKPELLPFLIPPANADPLASLTKPLTECTWGQTPSSDLPPTQCRHHTNSLGPASVAALCPSHPPTTTHHTTDSDPRAC